VAAILGASSEVAANHWHMSPQFRAFASFGSRNDKNTARGFFVLPHKNGFYYTFVLHPVVIIVVIPTTLPLYLSQDKDFTTSPCMILQFSSMNHVPCMVCMVCDSGKKMKQENVPIEKNLNFVNALLSLSLRCSKRSERRRERKGEGSKRGTSMRRGGS
jgi:hypothetical protein